MLNKKMKLHNGVEIPVIGLGTWLIDDSVVEEAVIKAIKLGYRHIDTAEAYGNERGVGAAIKHCGVPREELFIQTKVVAEIKDYENAKIAIEDSFKKLDVDYIDLMIIHCPQPWNEYHNGNHYFEGNLAVWRALIEYYKAGKIRSIGVSNFEIVDIQNLIDNSDVKPMVNQIPTHIGYTPFDIIKYCQENDIVIEAYSPIAHGRLLDNEEVKMMAEKYGVSIPQLSIRYTLQLGAVSLPKTVHEEYMKQNADVDFEISKEDMKKLFDLDKEHDHSFF